MVQGWERHGKEGRQAFCIYVHVLGGEWQEEGFGQNNERSDARDGKLDLQPCGDY